MPRLIWILPALTILLGLQLVALAADVAEKVFLTSVNGPLVVDVSDGALRIRKVEWAADGNTYMIDGKSYPLNWSNVREKNRKLDVRRRLSVKSGVLYFDREAVGLPRGVKMRIIWNAILWKGWVLCLGRTSETDKEANDTPPFFASELVAFKTTERRAVVHYLTFQPPQPEDAAFGILQAQP